MKHRDKLTKINEELLVDYMLTTLGPLTTVHVLMDIHHQQKNNNNQSLILSPRLFGKILCEGKVWFKKKKLIHDALETLDSYLYPTKPLAMAPQFLSVHNIECQIAKVSVLSFIFDNFLFSLFTRMDSLNILN
jgi:hypothetical protein